MRIGVFFQADDGALAGQILEAVKQGGLNAVAYKLGRCWEELDGEEISFNFSSITHFILVPGEGSRQARWIAFISGFAMGGEKTLVLYLDETKSVPHHYLGGAHVFRNFESLLAFLKEEEEIWDKSFQIEKAREALISLGFGINEENFSQRVALGDEESVANFLKIGYSPDTINAQGVPLICIATRNGHRRIIELLIDRGAQVNVLSQDRGNSPLMEAAVRGDEASVVRLLDVGADPNLVSKSGQTALMLAIGEGHKGIVRVLLQYHAGVDVQDSLGMTARKYAEIFRHEEILELLNQMASPAG